MATHLLYQLDSYQQEFEAIVVEAFPERNAIMLDQSAFYPGGGGQPADEGWLHSATATWNVVRLEKGEGGPAHLLEGTQSLPQVGERLKGSLDWARRYRLMRTHTAMHILCGVVFRDYGAHVTGGEMEPLKGRMDFEFESLQKEFIQEIEARVNQEVDANRTVRVAILPRKEAFKIPDLIRTRINLLPEGIREVRIVDILGLDLQADGGTHVHATGEVGRMRIVDYKSKGRINKRIYVELIE